MKSLTYEAPSTNRLAIHHDTEKFPAKWQERIQLRKKQVSQAIQSILEPKIYTVQPGDTIVDIERVLGVNGFGTSLLLGVKTLVGKTVEYDGKRVQVKESGTSFSVRSATNVQELVTHFPLHPAANDDKFPIAA